MYTKPLGDLIKRHGLDYHFYADDTQLYIFLKRNDKDSHNAQLQRLENCLDAIASWMVTNRLKLNADKTEVMFFSPRNCQLQIDFSVCVNGVSTLPSNSLRNLGVVFDRSMTMDSHINSVTRACYMHLRNIGRIRRSITDETAKFLVHGLITSRLDYCNSLLHGLPDSSTWRLQRVQNMAARIITRTKRSDHISPILQNLHWLPVKARIEYKLLLNVFNATRLYGPSYLSELVELYVPSTPLRSQSNHNLVVPFSKSRLGDRSFKVSGPKLFNELPEHIRTANTVSTFRRSLKTFLFKKYLD